MGENILVIMMLIWEVSLAAKRDTDLLGSMEKKNTDLI